MIKLLLALILLILPLQASAQVAENNSCKYIYVKLGPHIFEIPIKNRPYLTFKGKQLRRPYCHQSKSQAIMVEEFSFTPWKIVSGHMVGQIIIDRHKNFEDGYIRVKKEMEQEGVTLADLPMKNGFRVYKKVNFITTQKESLTPSGNPMLFNCGSCRTIFLWKDDIRIQLNLIDESILQNSNVKEFKDGIIKYLEQLEVSPEQPKGN